jgi:MFS family permease
VVGALYLASRSSVLGLGRVMMLSTVTFGAALVAFSLTHTLWLALLILPIVGGGFMIEMASTNTILQTITEESLRGRVMAFYTMAFLGTAPLGSLLAGAVAARIGAQPTILLGGTVCIAAGVWLALKLDAMREQVRPIYIERGILVAADANAESAGSPL